MHRDPVERMRLASKRLAEAVEPMAQTAARRATEMAVEAIDVNALLDRTDINKLVEQVDLNQLLEQVDVNQLLDRVDVNSLIARVDMEALLSRVDVNEVVDRVDVAALVDRTELGAIVARSSSTIFSEGIDLVRSQAVGLDDFLARWVSRLLRRGRYAGPPAPASSPSLADVQVQR